MLHQFTTDRTILKRAIDRIRVSRVAFFGEEDEYEKEAKRLEHSAGGGNAFPSSDSDLTPETQSGLQAASGLESLNYLIGSMRQLPGRKAVVMMSPGFGAIGVARGKGGSTAGVSSAFLEYTLKRLAEGATRAGVVIDTVDMFGLRGAPANLFPRAIGITEDHALNAFFGIDSDYSAANTLDPGEEWGRQSVLRRLADETGGTAIVNTNDLKGGVEQISRDLNGYYLLSYSPENIKRDGGYHRIAVKVKDRGGLRVRTRDGYYAGAKAGKLGFATSVSTEPPPGANSTERLLYQMMSPLAARKLRLQPSIYYGQNASGTVSVQALLFIPGEDVSFRKDKSVSVSSLDVAGFFFDERGSVVSQFARRLQSGWSAQSYQDTLERGLVISNRLTLKPGFYQFRTVVRDNFTNRLGSASQSLFIPDPAKAELQLAPVILTTKRIRELKDAAEASREAELLQTRRLLPRQGTIEFLAQVFGARVAKKTGRPALEQQVIIYREGGRDFESPKTPVRLLTQSSSRLVYAGGTINLANFAPGRYVLMLKVVDTLASKERNTAMQYLLFTVLE